MYTVNIQLPDAWSAQGEDGEVKGGEGHFRRLRTFVFMSTSYKQRERENKICRGAMKKHMHRKSEDREEEEREGTGSNITATVLAIYFDRSKNNAIIINISEYMKSNRCTTSSTTTHKQPQRTITKREPTEGGGSRSDK